MSYIFLQTSQLITMAVLWYSNVNAKRPGEEFTHKEGNRHLQVTTFEMVKALITVRLTRSYLLFCI